MAEVDASVSPVVRQKRKKNALSLHPSNHLGTYYTSAVNWTCTHIYIYQHGTYNIPFPSVLVNFLIVVITAHTTDTYIIYLSGTLEHFADNHYISLSAHSHAIRQTTLHQFL